MIPPRDLNGTERSLNGTLSPPLKRFSHQRGLFINLSSLACVYLKLHNRIRIKLMIQNIHTEVIGETYTRQSAATHVALVEW